MTEGWTDDRRPASNKRPASSRRPAAAAALNLVPLLLGAVLACSFPRGASAARTLRSRNAATMCVPTTLEFVPVSDSDAALIAAQTNPTPLFASLPLCSGRQNLALPDLRAVDDCGRELPVAVAVAPASSAAAAAGVAALSPGGTLNLQGGDGGVPLCGAYEVVYSAELAGGDLLAEKTFTFERLCPDAADAAADAADAAPCL
jgi:hypothetical protein